MFAFVTMAGCSGAKTESTERLVSAVSTNVATGSFHLEAVTSDGYAIVSDLKANTVNAVRLATKTSTSVLAVPLTDPRTLNNGPTVLLWHDLNATGDGAQLSAWSAASGTKLLSSNAVLDNFNDAIISDDGQRIAFIEHVDANTDQVVIDNPSHTARQVVTTALSACPGHRVRFVAGVTQRLAVSYCISAPPGGRRTSVFNVTNSPPYPFVNLASGGADLFFRIDPTGSRALVHDVSGSLIISLDGTMSDVIDAGAVRGIFLLDGVELVYTSGGALKRVAAGGLPETVQTSGASGVLGLMGDASAVFYYNVVDATTGLTDIYLNNLLVDGPRVQVGINAGALEAPSSDNKHLLFYNGLDAAARIGTFDTQLPSGGTISPVGSGKSVVNGDFELGNDKVVFNDGFIAATATTPEQVNLESIDFSQATPTVTPLVTGADAAFLPTWDGTMAVYTTSSPAPGGLFTVAVP
jgi:hypothetical protein